MINSIRGALAQMGTKTIDVKSLALRKAPLSEKDYVEVLVDSGMQGRMFRALVNLTGAPVSSLRITNVSGFGSERNLFAAFAEAREYRVVQPIRETVPYYIGSGIGESLLAIKNRPRIMNVSDYYYLTPFHETDVVLAPHACDCCFDFVYLDYLKSAFELIRQGALLLIRFDAAAMRQFLDDPLFDWMKEAGFEAHWFFGTDNIFSWEVQRNEGKGLNLQGICELTRLQDVSHESWELYEKYNRAIPKEKAPVMFGYLVFQRMTYPSRDNMLSLFANVIRWEGTFLGHRLCGRAGRFVRAQKYLAKFEEMLPVFLASYQSAGEQK